MQRGGRRLRGFHEREKDGVLGPEFEYAITGGVPRFNRFFPFSLKKETHISLPVEAATHKIGRQGQVDTVHWAGQQMPAAPTGDEVEVTVYAAGLNFGVSWRLERHFIPP